MSRMTAAHSMTKMCETEVRACRGAQPLPEAAVLADGHVHGRVTLHRPGQALVGLGPGGLDESLAQEQPEERRRAGRS